jgi:superfamily II DNA/RNA helicase
MHVRNMFIIFFPVARGRMGLAPLSIKQPISAAQRTVTFFLATVPLDAFNLMDQFMHNPLKILIQPEQLTLDGISQFHVAADKQFKMETLVEMVGCLTIQKSVILANRVESSSVTGPKSRGNSGRARP